MGFNDTGATWLPQPQEYRELAVDRQTGVPGSTLELYRTLLGARREHDLGTGGLCELPGYGDDVIAYVNEAHDGSRTAVLVNLGEQPAPLPSGRLVAASGELLDGALPTDTAAWVLLD